MTICIICKKNINEKFDKIVRLTDFNFGIKNGEVFYHYECWYERFKITNSERKKEMYNKAIKSIIKIKDSINKGGIPTY